MSYTECHDFERKLAYHSAPTLLGIKPANLLSLLTVDEIALKSIDNMLSKKRIKIKVVCQCKSRKLILVYNEKMLTMMLSESNRKNLLVKLGYDVNESLEHILDRLSERISGSDGFPHEIGIFLGYPIEDVLGFIENKGENFKFCGYWKVYGDEEKAKKTFENYNKCRNFLFNKLNQGYDIYQALKIS